jgi:hypothetical protein
VITSASAISRLLRPAATSWTTSRSRPVRRTAPRQPWSPWQPERVAGPAPEE